MIFPEAQRTPSRSVLEVAADHICDIRPPPKLTGRVSYQWCQISSEAIERSSAQTSMNVRFIQARISSRMLRISSKCPFSVFGVPFGAFTP